MFVLGLRVTKNNGIQVGLGWFKGIPRIGRRKFNQKVSFKFLKLAYLFLFINKLKTFKLKNQASMSCCCVPPFEVRPNGDLGADLARQQSLGLT